MIIKKLYQISFKQYKQNIKQFKKIILIMFLNKMNKRKIIMIGMKQFKRVI